jgi:epoxide hydrolase-like predicted phosphatase
MVEPSIRAIVYDFGGVFTRADVSAAHLRFYDELLGLPSDTLQCCLFAGEAWELRSTGRITAEAYWEWVGKPYEARLPADFRKYQQGMFWDEPINEEMIPLAQRLHQFYPQALCSNALQELAEILDSRTELGSLFDVRVISMLDGLRKPDPAIYHLVAERLNLPLETCLLIDDKPRNTSAAQSTGMPAIIFQSVPQLVTDLAAFGISV